LVLAGRGQLDEAIVHYQKALDIKSDYAAARQNLAVVLDQRKRSSDGIAQRRELIRSRPNDVAALNDIAWILATSPNASFRNASEAVEFAERAAKLSGGQEPAILDTLAAAYAEAGRFAEAVQTAQQSFDLATRQNKQAMAESIKAKIRLYETNTPLREQPKSR
jgi:protein O-mannosyl-transferase